MNPAGLNAFSVDGHQPGYVLPGILSSYYDFDKPLRELIASFLYVIGTYVHLLYIFSFTKSFYIIQLFIGSKLFYQNNYILYYDPFTTKQSKSDKVP